jgi:uncharacterized phage protein (TIGR01671 family)
MREIKFRVWDTKQGKFLVNPKVEFTHETKSWGKEFYLEISEDWFAEDYDPRRYIFLQATGIKDKNGKEIYEGDILRHKQKNSFGKYFENFYSVEWSLLVGYDDPGVGYQLNPEEINDFEEVVGNIYENPELLNKDRNEI